MAGAPGFEPGNAGIKTQCLNRLATPQKLYGIFRSHPGSCQDYSVPPCTSPCGPACGRSNFVPDIFVKPRNTGIKTQCLNRLAAPQKLLYRSNTLLNGCTILFFLRQLILFQACLQWRMIRTFRHETFPALGQFIIDRFCLLLLIKSSKNTRSCSGHFGNCKLT